VKLVLDMHISVEVARGLRDDGHDAFQLRERGLQRLTDIEITALAEFEERVIVTFDLDFSAILARSGASRPSIIQFRIEKTEADVVLKWLREVIPIYMHRLSEGCILSIEPDRIRVRKLPLI